MDEVRKLARAIEVDTSRVRVVKVRAFVRECECAWGHPPHQVGTERSGVAGEVWSVPVWCLGRGDERGRVIHRGGPRDLPRIDTTPGSGAPTYRPPPGGKRLFRCEVNPEGDGLQAVEVDGRFARLDLGEGKDARERKDIDGRFAGLELKEAE